MKKIKAEVQVALCTDTKQGKRKTLKLSYPTVTANSLSRIMGIPNGGEQNSMEKAA